MTYSRNRPTPEGEVLGCELARLVAPAIDAYRARYPGRPGPCASCAFQAGTVPNRCLTTVANALKCAMEQVPFMCHEGTDMAAGEQPGEDHYCIGWVAWWLTAKDQEPVTMPYDWSAEIPPGAKPGDPELAPQEGGTDR